jgi:hypothetical protein
MIVYHNRPAFLTMEGKLYNKWATPVWYLTKGHQTKNKNICILIYKTSTFYNQK